MKFKQIAIFFVALALITCSSSTIEEEQDQEQEDDLPVMQLKVMSFNILYSGGTEHTGDHAWSARKEPVMTMLREELPDVIGFQEPRTDQINDLVVALPEYAFFAIPLTAGTTSMHNTIMYRKDKYDLINSGHF